MSNVLWSKKFGPSGWNLRVEVEFDEAAGFYVVLKTAGFGRNAPDKEFVLPGIFLTLEAAVARADEIIL